MRYLFAHRAPVSSTSAVCAVRACLPCLPRRCDIMVGTRHQKRHHRRAITPNTVNNAAFWYMLLPKHQHFSALNCAQHTICAYYLTLPHLTLPAACANASRAAETTPSTTNIFATLNIAVTCKQRWWTHRSRRARCLARVSDIAPPSRYTRCRAYTATSALRCMLAYQTSIIGGVGGRLHRAAAVLCT